MTIFPISIRVIAVIASAALIAKFFWNPEMPWSWIIAAFFLDALVGLRIVLDW